MVLIGTYMVVAPPFPLRVWVAAVAMWAITAFSYMTNDFGYMTNDLVDLVEDRINNPTVPFHPVLSTLSP